MAELRPKVPGLRKVTFFEMGGSAMALAVAAPSSGRPPEGSMPVGSSDGNRMQPSQL